jgi:flavorubredoxin
MESGWIKSHSWDCYSKKFAPETVMKKFESVFLTSLKQLPKETIQFSIRDHGQVLAFQLRRKIHSFLRKFYNLIF